MRLPRQTTNLYKVITGVAFSLAWASVMYMLWPQPSYLVFLWFYLGIGSIVLKWVFFEIIDRINTSLRLKRIRQELEESQVRVRESGADILEAGGPVACDTMVTIGMTEEMAELQKEIAALGKLVAMAVEGAVESLKRKDMALARTVVEGDRYINLKQSRIRDYCMQIIARTCPKADDLNTIIAALGMSIDLERMGDYAKGIARITMMMGRGQLSIPRGIHSMMTRGVEMLRESLVCFSERNIDRAGRVFKMDDEVDTLHDDVFRELIRSMVEDPRRITQAIWLVWVAHDLERFADRVTNIVEWVLFSAGCEMPDLRSGKLQVASDKYQGTTGGR
ncbi:MAG: phosphate signaling complex protein PhoU [Chloroflexi bacterium]|nr:phosphate signaling complex protein PhoU [Chloroflexota bacterium]